MKQRGRKSAAALSIVSSRPIEAIQRPVPPKHLGKEASAEWKAVVGRLPPEWFPRETWAMLAQYCQHTVMARALGKAADKLISSKEFNIDEFERMSKMMERETRIIASLATRMRITQQSTYDKSKKKPITAPKPWEA